MIKKSIAIPLMVALLLGGCTPAVEPTPAATPEAIVEAYLLAFSSDDIETSLSLLADDVVFYQDPPGIRIEGKTELETILRENTAWHHQHSLTSPFSVYGDKVTCSAKISGDDFKIIGIEYMNADYEFIIRSEKIHSITIKPDSEDWAKCTELTSGGIGVKIDFVEQGVKVKAFAENSPAYKSGVRLGDVITAVDKVSYSQMREGEIILRIHGPVGSKVLLTIIREGMTDPIDIEVTRVDLGQLNF